MGPGLESHLRQLWQERVHSKYLFRGMSAKDLRDPLDPSADPFAAFRPKVYRLLAVFEQLLASGFRFTVHEDYSGLSFDLRDIVAWTRGDLDNPGIDFTSSHESASGYAQNFQGSQLKQNLRYITLHLPERRSEPLVEARMRQRDWGLVSEIGAWASQVSPAHQPVVIWVRRSCPALESDVQTGPLLGSFEWFCEQVLRRLASKSLPLREECVAQVLPEECSEFCVRLAKPLGLREIERIEEVSRGA
jgi:hypothetical protein